MRDFLTNLDLDFKKLEADFCKIIIIDCYFFIIRLNNE